MTKRIFDNRLNLILESPIQERILLHLLSVDEDYVTGIANAIGTAHSSVCRLIQPLLDADILQDRWIGHVRVIAINPDSPNVQAYRRSIGEPDELRNFCRREI